MQIPQVTGKYVAQYWQVGSDFNQGFGLHESFVNGYFIGALYRLCIFVAFVL